MSCNNLTIKKVLESTFDIPFDVVIKSEYNDPVYCITPVNDMDELFSIKILIRQNIRLIIEMEPQKYAADMVTDINHAGEEKRTVFFSYLSLCRSRNAKVECSVNNRIIDIEEASAWNDYWKQFAIRITSIINEDIEDETEYIVSWAKLTIGMVLSLLNIEKEENKFAEGGVTRSLTNRYERNPANRELCLATHGYLCKICGFDFEKTYGKIGKNFIHVHHIEKISLHEEAYYLDPENDLIPVCPNCHAMLHRVDPPMKPEELKKIISSLEKEN